MREVFERTVRIACLPFARPVNGSGLRRGAMLIARVARGRGMAERGGFEPPVPFPVHLISNQAPSTTRTSLQYTEITNAIVCLLLLTDAQIAPLGHEWGTLGSAYSVLLT